MNETNGHLFVQHECSNCGTKDALMIPRAAIVRAMQQRGEQEQQQQQMVAVPTPQRRQRDEEAKAGEDAEFGMLLQRLGHNPRSQQYKWALDPPDWMANIRQREEEKYEDTDDDDERREKQEQKEEDKAEERWRGIQEARKLLARAQVNDRGDGDYDFNANHLAVVPVVAEEDDEDDDEPFIVRFRHMKEKKKAEERERVVPREVIVVQDTDDDDERRETWRLNANDWTWVPNDQLFWSPSLCLHYNPADKTYDNDYGLWTNPETGERDPMPEF